MNRRTVQLCLAAVLLLISACGPRERPAAGGRAPVVLRFNMSWLPQGSMGGVIAAIDKGYYAQAGLQVSPMRGFGGIRTVNELDQGLFEVAYADPVSVGLNRAHGGRTLMVAPLNTRWPACVCFIEERRKIRQPADLVGLTLGGGQNSPMQRLVPAWLRRNGVDPARVRILQLDPAVVAASLIEGKIDAAECWEGNSLPTFRKRAQQAGVTMGWLPYAAHGLDLYGGGIVTTQQQLTERPQVMRDFVAATRRGYAYAAANPDEVAALMVKRFPTLDLAMTREQIVETAGLVQGADAGFSAERVASSVAFINEAYGPGAAPLKAGDIFDVQSPKN